MAEAHEQNPMVVIASRQDPTVAKQALTLEIIKREDDVTTNAVIDCFSNDERFIKQSRAVTEEIIQRDLEDAAKLQKGIDAAIEKGVLAKIEEPKYNQVSVFGKSADEVAQSIIDKCDKNGCVIVLCGLSGTGKGTTVKKIMEKVQNSMTWSNGNIFRSLTLLTKAYADKNDKTVQQVVEEDESVLEKLMESLSFENFEDKGWDTKIENADLEIGPLYVNEVKNTTLKAKDVATNIPTVAGKSQALVVKYVDKAVKQLGDAGYTVLVEGRQATVNYVNTEFRFNLVLEDTSIIGQRRMAQRMVGEALKANIETDDYNLIYEALAAPLAPKPAKAED